MILIVFLYNIDAELKKRKFSKYEKGKIWKVIEKFKRKKKSKKFHPPPKSSSKPLVCCWELQVSAQITTVENIIFNFFLPVTIFSKHANIQVKWSPSQMFCWTDLWKGGLQTINFRFLCSLLLSPFGLGSVWCPIEMFVPWNCMSCI